MPPPQRAPFPLPNRLKLLKRQPVWPAAADDQALAGQLKATPCCQRMGWIRTRALPVCPCQGGLPEGPGPPLVQRYPAQEKAVAEGHGGAPLPHLFSLSDSVSSFWGVPGVGESG